MPQPNLSFVGRTTELEELRQALTVTGRSAITQSRQAISGLGGIGKTQLALAYAYAQLDAYGLIRWLRAEEPAVLAADYAAMAPALRLDPGMPDQAALLAAIRGRLERTDRWLLVFDNATEPGALDPYLPRGGGGHVLITSRWQEWEGAAAVLELDLLPEAEAVALLLGEAADDAAHHAAAAELARELGHLPLALAQARAFMRARKVGIAGYRQQLAAARPKVLAWRPPNAGYPLAMAQAWQASLDHAAHDCSAAGELMPLLAFLGPDAIPRDLLGAKAEALPEGLRDPFDRDGAIEALGRFSLVRVEPDSLTVHRLVQAVTREGLDEAASARCAATTVALVDAALPRPSWEHVHWPMVGKLLPHALVAAEAAERFGVGLVAAATILHDVAAYHHARAAWSEAEPLLRRALAIRERTLGPEHPDFATALNHLGLLYQVTGRYAEAEPLHKRAIAIRERALGPEHPDLAISLDILGRLYQDTGRLRRGRAAPPARARHPRADPRPRASQLRLLAPQPGPALPAHRPLRRGRAAPPARARHPRASPRPRASSRRRIARQPGPSSTGSPAATPRPSRSSSARSPPTSGPSAPSIPTSPSRSTTWPSSTGSPVATPKPSRSTSARLPSARKPYRPTIRT